MVEIGLGYWPLQDPRKKTHNLTHVSSEFYNCFTKKSKILMSWSMWWIEMSFIISLQEFSIPEKKTTNLTHVSPVFNICFRKKTQSYWSVAGAWVIMVDGNVFHFSHWYEHGFQWLSSLFFKQNKNHEWAFFILFPSKNATRHSSFKISFPWVLDYTSISVPPDIVPCCTLYTNTCNCCTQS